MGVSLGRVEDEVHRPAEVVSRVRENRALKAVVFGEPNDTELGVQRVVTRPHLDVPPIDVHPVDSRVAVLVEP